MKAFNKGLIVAAADDVIAILFATASAGYAVWSKAAGGSASGRMDTADGWRG